VGDVGLILGMVFTYHALGSLDLVDIADNAGGLAREGLWQWGPATIACLLLFLGATGKSAQIPLHVWLPDAMEGPTPVSALIHAATMVTAGVYMVARTHVLFLLAPASLETVAVIGAATALFAATIGLAQNDIKRVLAYSTVSQLGYMFFACGVGAFGAGIFHLMTHAFFKALLFLGAGSVIHALSNEQDMRRMGGLAGRLPWTHGVMLVGCIAIAGIPPFAGFFSKDEILTAAYASGHYGVWIAGLLGAVLTAFYMFRLYVLTFRGPSRLTHEAEHHLHESPRSMIIPLVVLAALSVVGGLVGPPMIEGGHPFARWLAPVFESEGGAHMAHEVSRGTEWMLIAISVAVAALGIWMAFRAYLQQPGLATSLQQRFSALHTAIFNKYWVDEFYDAIVVRPLNAASQGLWRFWDEKIVDGTVNGVAYTLEGASAILRLFQTGFVGTYALFITLGVAALLLHFLRIR
jgi:NADH-quinone oxidoreductase subunit L